MADTSQPQVYDYASPNQWRLNFQKLPITTWFCTNCNIPGVNIGEAQFPTPLSDAPLVGDKLTFDTLNITFIVDEELVNYREIWDWIVGIGFPKNHSQYDNAIRDGQRLVASFGGDTPDPRVKSTFSDTNLYSDATLIYYNSKNIAKIEVRFTEIFPISISGLEFVQDATDVDYLRADVSFRFMYYTFATAS